MESPTFLNYEIRPCKFVERRMLLVSLARIMGALKLQYQYIGFGGLTFTDFKLFHRELHINNMYSIEGGYCMSKLEFNKPYSCISILHGQSTEMLPSIELNKRPSIIWLDYDGVLSIDIFSDLELIFHAVPRGSIYIMSCNRQLKKDNNPYTNEELKEKFGKLVPYNIQENCCKDAHSANTIRSMIENHCRKTLKDRNKLGETLVYKSLFNIRYGEYRGARMFTCGGIILDEQEQDIDLNLRDLEYIGTEQPYEINIPNLTYKEANSLNQVLNLPDKEKALVEDGIISEEEIELYKKNYKYLPNFYDVRM